MAKRRDGATGAAKSLELMAGAMAGEIIRDIELGLIDNNPHQPRKSMDKEALEELTESVKAKGVIQPIVVRKIAGKDGETRYESAFGHRRRAACAAAKKKTIPAIVREYDDHSMLIIALTENVQREAMTVSDEVNAASQLVGLVGQKEAADMLGKPKTWISKVTGIAKAPECVQSFIESGFTTDIEGLYQLAQLAKKNIDGAKQLIEDWHRDPDMRADLRGQITEINAPVKTLASHVEPDEKTKAEQQSGIEYEPDNNSSQEFGADGFTLEMEADGKPESKNKASSDDEESEHIAKPPKVKDKPLLLSDAQYKDGVLTLFTTTKDVKFNVTDDALELLYAAIKE